MKEPYVSIELDGIEARFEALLCTAENMNRIYNYMEEQREVNAFKEHVKGKTSVAVLKNLWVEEEERGQGYGIELMELFLSAVQEEDICHVYLIADNLEENSFDLVSWYESCGFRKITPKDECPLMYAELE